MHVCDHEHAHACWVWSCVILFIAYSFSCDSFDCVLYKTHNSQSNEPLIQNLTYGIVSNLSYFMYMYMCKCKCTIYTLTLQKEWKIFGLSPGISGGTATPHMKWDTIPARRYSNNILNRNHCHDACNSYPNSKVAPYDNDIELVT